MTAQLNTISDQLLSIDIMLIVIALLLTVLVAVTIKK